MRTVVRLPNWVGDTIAALPAIEALLRAERGDIVLAGRGAALELMAALEDAAGAPGAQKPALLRLSDAGASLSALLRDVRAVRRHRPRRGVTLSPSFSSALCLWLAGVPQRWGWPEQGRGVFLTHAIARARRGTQALTEEFAHLARALGAHPVAGPPRLPEVAEEGARAEALWRRREGAGAGGTPRIVLCPGARYGGAKRWPVESFARLARELAAEGVGGIVLGSASERDLAERICSASPGAWENAAGMGSVHFAAALLRRAALAVVNDTGAMHLAAAVGTPLVALFGSTDPAWSSPLGHHGILLRKPMACAPCFRRECPQGDPAPCMSAITPEEVREEVNALLRSEAIRADRRALLLDRDGTLLEPVAYLHTPQRARLLPGSGAALRRARAAGYRLIVTTNQSGVARGLFGAADVDAVHAAVQDALLSAGVALDAFYFCPHHPDFGGACGCRKPEPGMLRRAESELGLDLKRSWAIGDTIEDVLAGVRAGAGAILVRTGYGAEQARARAGELPAGVRVVDDLAGAVDVILGAEQG